MKHFLSVDLDYWSEALPVCEAAFFVKQLTDFVKKHHVPFQVVIVHHAGVDFVNQYPADAIINVDFHSDIAEYDNWNERLSNRRIKGKIEFNSGTWLNFIKKKNEFQWFYPNHHYCFDGRWGRCESDFKAGLFNRSLSEQWRAACGFKEMRWKQGLPDFDALELTGAALCLSPDWIEKSCLANFVEILLKAHRAVPWSVFNGKILDLHPETACFLKNFHFERKGDELFLPPKNKCRNLYI